MLLLSQTSARDFFASKPRNTDQNTARLAPVSNLLIQARLPVSMQYLTLESTSMIPYPGFRYTLPVPTVGWGHFFVPKTIGMHTII